MLQNVARFLTLACITSLAVNAPTLRSVQADDREEFFERKVRPLLAAKCLECHGNDEPEGGLRLTSQAHVLKGGTSGAAVVLNKPQESRLLKAVQQTGPLKMPPNGKLSDVEIGFLAQWIELGLPWPKSSETKSPRKEFVIADVDRQHWAFRPMTEPAPPAVRDAAWSRTTIDRFVLAKLEAEGLKPSISADRRTLLRRASYDLTGLPPTWDETQSFLNDPAADARGVGKVVDRLLDSPRYGERWGRHWLDVARFADTKDGVLMYGDDRIRPYAYTYRDYVIRAFNEDTPFDQFVQEQLAADLIEPKVEPWRLAAMGFLTLGRMYDNNVHDIIDDQIDTVSRGFLGLTVACARCHDHKYDPIPTADYYSLYGVFASSEAPLELPLTASTPSSPGGGIREAGRRQARRDAEVPRRAIRAAVRNGPAASRRLPGACRDHQARSAGNGDLLPVARAGRPAAADRRSLAKVPRRACESRRSRLRSLARLDAIAARREQSGGRSPLSAPFAQPPAEVLERWKSKPEGTQTGNSIRWCERT